MKWSTLKKFGLQHCDLPTMIWNINVTLRILVLNIDIRNKKPISWVSYLISFVLASSYFYMYVVSMAWFLYVRRREYRDLLSTVGLLSLGISSGPLKLALMFIYNTKLRQIITECLGCNASVISRNKFSENLLNSLRQVKKRAIIFWIVLGSDNIMYFLKPLFLPGKHLIEDKFVFYGLEPKLETPNYEIAYILNVTANAFVTYVTLNVTALFIIIMGFIEAQMLALAQEITHVWDNAEEHFSKINKTSISGEIEGYQATKSKIMNKYVEENLKFVIKTHCKNISILQQIQYVFSGAITLEFFLLIIGIIVELLGGIEKTYMEYIFGMIQVSTDCFLGQRVIDASKQFERAVYDCQWENFDKSNMKIVQILLANAQKSMKFSAGGGIIVLSFACLMQINRSVYSAYTTLRTFM